MAAWMGETVMLGVAIVQPRLRVMRLRPRRVVVWVELSTQETVASVGEGTYQSKVVGPT